MTASVTRPWVLKDREKVYDTRWLSVWRDEVVGPDGAGHVYDHVMLPASATVLAINAIGRVAVTRQWVYTHEQSHWRLPSGGVEQGDADPAAAARRELREETGLTARKWESLGTVNGADSTTNHRDHVFLATGLTRGHAHLDGGESDLEVHWVPFAKVLDLVMSGKMMHAGSAFAVLVAARGPLSLRGAGLRLLSRIVQAGKRKRLSVAR